MHYYIVHYYLFQMQVYEKRSLAFLLLYIHQFPNTILLDKEMVITSYMSEYSCSLEQLATALFQYIGGTHDTKVYHITICNIQDTLLLSKLKAQSLLRYIHLCDKQQTLNLNAHVQTDFTLPQFIYYLQYSDPITLTKMLHLLEPYMKINKCEKEYISDNTLKVLPCFFQTCPLFRLFRRFGCITHS